MKEITPVYVDLVPEVIEPGKLYIAKEFHTAVHLCPCGCGHQVVIRLGDENKKDAIEWSLSDNNGIISISPSIEIQGNCRSHYYIRENKFIF